MLHAWITLPLVVAFAGQPAEAMADAGARTIRVSGEGVAAAPPDEATVHTGVTTEAKTAGEALAANNEAMEKVRATLQEFGIDPKGVQTSQFNVQPVRDRGPDREAPPEVVAYRVTNQVRVRVRKLSELGKILDALVRAGSNQLSGLTLGVGDPTAVLDEARRKAVADARRRAGVYAEAAGVRVGKVRVISEEPVSPPRPLMLGRAAAFEAASAVPVAAGENEFRVRVHVVFALEDPDGRE